MIADTLIQHNSGLRLGAFVLGLIIWLLAEQFWPKRVRDHQRASRWSINLSLVVLSSILVRILLPAGALMITVYAQNHTLGLFNLVSIHSGLAFIFSLLLLDLTIYWQHRLFHRLPILWRLHQVHHTDPDIDVTTAVRFHPIEILISMGVKCTAVIFLGVPPAAVILFEIILNGCAMFNHSNLNLRNTWDRRLRYVLVTPDMHRVHHSTEPQEHHSNFGFSLSCWDRYFASYYPQPKAGHQGMRIGLKKWSLATDNMNLLALLKMPFKR